MPEILSMQGVHKRFGAVHAPRGVSLAVEEGDIHALIGENGAGKSTLMKIISGAYQADAGEIYYKGENYRIQSPADARQQGIGMIYQELNLAMHLTVMENLSLGIEVHRCGFVKDQRSKAKDALALLGYDIDLQAKVYELSNAERQIVEMLSPVPCFGAQNY